MLLLLLAVYLLWVRNLSRFFNVFIKDGVRVCKPILLRLNDQCLLWVLHLRRHYKILARLVKRGLFALRRCFEWGE